MNEPRPHDDELLSAIAQRRDRKAFAELFARHQDRAYALAWHLTHDRDLAEEAVQEAMLRLWNGARHYRPGNARGYLLRIVARESIRVRRRQTREERKAMESEGAHRPGASHTGDLEQAEVFAALKAAMGRMNREEGELVMLAVGAGMTHKEIGELYKIPRRTISDRIQSALEHLRRELSRAGFAHLATGGATAGALQEALLAGPSAPPALLEQVLQGLNAAGLSARAAEFHAAKAGWTAKAVAAGVLTVAALAAWVAYQDHAPSTPPVAKPVAATSAPKQYNRTLTFDKAEDYDLLRFDTGVWSRVDRGGKDDGPALLAESEPIARLTLKLPELKLPVRIDVDLCPTNMVNKKTFDVGISALFDGQSAEVFFEKSIIQIRRPGTWLKGSFYISENGTDLYMNDRRTHLILCRPVMRENCLGLTFAGDYILDNLTVREITPEEVPSVEPYLSALQGIPPQDRRNRMPAPGLEKVIFDFEPPEPLAPVENDTDSKKDAQP